MPKRKLSKSKPSSSNSKKKAKTAVNSNEQTEESIDPEVLPPDPHFDEKAIIPASAPPAETDPLITYLSEIRKYPLLTPEEEHSLAVKFKETGDREAAERLVTSNLRFVVKIAAEYSKFGVRMIDLIQEGNVGLMHAVR